MASFSRALMMLTVTAAIFSSIATAEEFIVGDDKGWTIGFDYQAWAADKVFHVGDKLIFKYPVGLHNVFKVNGTDFANCKIPEGADGLTSGDDVIELATAGRKWYMCGVGMHCQVGQKLVITVLPEGAAVPSASPWAPAPAPAGWTAHKDFSRWVPRKLFHRFIHY